MIKRRKQGPGGNPGLIQDAVGLRSQDFHRAARFGVRRQNWERINGGTWNFLGTAPHLTKYFQIHLIKSQWTWRAVNTCVCRRLRFFLSNLTESHPVQPYLFCFCLSLSFFEEEPKCWPFSSSSPAAFRTLPCTEVGSLAMSGATSHTPLRSEELKSETGVMPNEAPFPHSCNGNSHGKILYTRDTGYSETSLSFLCDRTVNILPNTRYLHTLFHSCL